MRRDWFTWEVQRRNHTLAEAFGCELHQFDYPGRSRLSRYMKCIGRTLPILLSRGKGDVVFAQAPSLVLTLLVTFLQRIRGYQVVIDAHNATTRLLLQPGALSTSLRFFFKYATILVSNHSLAERLRSREFKSEVLPDKLPELPPADKVAQSTTITLICSFCHDEPVREFLEGFEMLDSDLSLRVTGRKSRAGELLQRESARIVFTDFLPDKEYIELIRRSRLLVVLTTNEDCLTCGAYEALSVGVPALLSDSKALRETFSKGFVFSGNSPEHYRSALEEFLKEEDALRSQIQAFRPEFESSWEEQFGIVKQALKLP